MDEFQKNFKIVDNICNFKVDNRRIGLDNLPMYVLGQSDDCVLWSNTQKWVRQQKRKFNNKKVEMKQC